ncbi:MAG: aspartate/glutamate racemase family protein [Planctomycetota bacterium]|jgi:Asp/Glu/hydantoin racemase
MAAIVVINPNSTEAITEELDRALDDLRAAGATEIRCLTLAAGPPGIESEAHIREVEQPLLELARGMQDEARAFVIACFSDPGLSLLRRSLPQPVLGIARSGLLTACSFAEKIGVISVSEASVARHLRLYRELGLSDRVAGDRAVEIGVTELVDSPLAADRLLATAGDLQADGAGAIVLGCTGMSAYRGRIEQAVGIPVIDPCRAAVAMATGFCA